MLGALPEMMQTTWGALSKALRLQKGDGLLIRGGTTSIGLAAAAIAYVAATTGKPEREMLLRVNGAEQVFIINGTIADQVKQTGEVNRIFERHLTDVYLQYSSLYRICENTALPALVFIFSVLLP